MSGSYIDAAGPTIAEDAAAIASGVTSAMTQAESGQSAAEAFIANGSRGMVGYTPPIVVTGE